MNIREYCRNKYGIAKLIDIENNNGIDVLIFDKPICFLVDKKTGEIKKDRFFNKLAIIDDIDLSKIKHSKKLIDLIEVGDLVYVDISPDDCGGIIVPRIAETERELNSLKLLIENKDYILKSIITHEQIESMEYKVKE